MSLPFLSAICLQYGEVAQLEDSLGCFLAQNYPAESEIVILNSFPVQRLHFEHPKVRIINLKVRPPSLADCRNEAIKQARGTHLITWDSDDAFAPWYLTTIAKHFTDGQWAWLDKQFYMVTWKIKGIVPGSMNSLVFTKDAWRTVGGYASGLNCGEDRQFAGKVTSSTPGKRVELQPEEIGFLYSWGEGNYHASGEGDDKPNRISSYERVRLNLEKRVARRLVPVGDITLHPRMRHPYGEMAMRFVSRLNRLQPIVRQPIANNLPHAPPHEQSQPTATNTEPTSLTAANQQKPGLGVVLLGRFGDIINILPVLKQIAENYGKPHLIVSAEFASLLEGVSYVEPFVLDCPNDKLAKAISVAKTCFKQLLVPQAWSTDMPHDRKTESYNKESWVKIGFGHKFDDKTWLPVFDRRNLVREAALCTKLLNSTKPALLVKLDGSTSSPFPQGHSLMEPIQRRFDQEFNIVDLLHVKAERIFDLLGLFDRARALVAVDTSLIHLAAGSPVPYVALTNPKPWLGTLPRGNCVARISYSEAMAGPDRVISAIETALAAPRNESARAAARAARGRRLFHAVERHEERLERRKFQARQSWAALYAAGVVPTHLTTYPRDASAIGDRRKLPYLRDVLTAALNQMADEDILIWTNDDVWLHPTLPDYLAFHVAVYGACSSQRCEFKGPLRPHKMMTPEGIARLSGRHMGRDMFAGTKKWFLAKWDQIGDPICGASDFDLHMAAIIRLDYGIQTTRQNIVEHIFPAEIPLGYVAHEQHANVWSRPHNINSAPSQKWNRAIFKRWAETHLPSLRFNSDNAI